jgi:hypothetical protein
VVRPIVIDELAEFEKLPVEVQDFKKSPINLVEGSIEYTPIQ